MSEVSVAVVEDDAGRILVAKRLSAAHLGGLHEFPGGKVRPSETPRQACVRECREELGIDVVVLGEAAPRKVHAYPDRTVALSFFRCALAPGSPAPRAIEAAEVRWVERPRLPELAWPEANREIVARLATATTPEASR